MFSQSQLDDLLAAMRANGVTRLDVSGDNGRLRLDIDGARSERAAVTNAARPENVTSPAIGRFLPRGLDDGLPELRRDANVLAGEVLGYVHNGTARAIIPAPANGRLRGDPPELGAVLGYGDVLFTMEAQT